MASGLLRLRARGTQSGRWNVCRECLLRWRRRQLDSIADNLATPNAGFKATRPAFRAFLPPGHRQSAGWRGIHRRGSAARSYHTTDNPLDVTPRADSYLRGESCQLGQIAYTRNGPPGARPDGELLASGCRCWSFGRSGERAGGRQPAHREQRRCSRGPWHRGGYAGALPAQGLWTGSTTLLQPSAGSHTAPCRLATLRVGELELGNVSALDCTVQMINAQASFDMAMQAIQTYQKLDERATQVGLVK